MQDDRSSDAALDPTTPDTDTDSEAVDGGILDEFDDAVIAADATGMLAGERLITQAEIVEGLEEGRNLDDVGG